MGKDYKQMYTKEELKEATKLYQHNFVLSNIDYDDISGNSLQFTILSTNPEAIEENTLEALSVKIAELANAETADVFLPAIGKTAADTAATTFQLQILRSYANWWVYSNSHTNTLKSFFEADYGSIYVSDNIVNII